MSAIDYILIILVLASLYLNWHLVQVCRSAMKARKKALRDAQRLLKRGEEAQEQAIVDKRRFLEALGEAFLLIGPAGHIVLANTLAKELFQEERLEGRKVGALVCNQELLGHVQEAFDYVVRFDTVVAGNECLALVGQIDHSGRTAHGELRVGDKVDRHRVGDGTGHRIGGANLLHGLDHMLLKLFRINHCTCLLGIEKGRCA